jgi:hypothetical protein
MQDQTLVRYLRARYQWVIERVVAKWRSNYGVRVDIGRVFVIVFVRIFDELLIEFPPRFELLIDVFEFMFDIEFILDVFDVPPIVFVEPPIEFKFIEFAL